MLEAARKGAYAVKQLHEGAIGRLAIATVATSGAFLARCLRTFGARYPDIVVDITYVSSGDALQDEGEDPYDFHFLHRDMLPDGDDFEHLVTHSDSLGLVVPKGHPLAGRELDVAALQKEKFILVSEEESPILYMQVMDFCQAHRFTPNVANRSSNVKSVLLSVSAGLGVTILPTALPEEMLAGTLAVVPIRDMDASITYAMAWKKSLLNPAARLFLEVVREIKAESFESHFDEKGREVL